MYSNYNNRRLVNNMGYQHRPTQYYDAIYVQPKRSVHSMELLNNRRVDYINSNVDGVMVGSGDSTVKTHTLYQAFKRLKALSNSQFSKDLESQVRNKFGKWQNDSNPNWRSGFPGERHLITKKGVSYNYAGPGTRLNERLARGDPPLDGPGGIDACAKTHDIAYANAQTIGDVRKADLVLDSCVKRSSGHLISKALVRGLMKAKMLGEDLSLIKPENITDLPNLGKTGDNYNPVTGSGGPIVSFAPKPKRKKKKDPAKRLRKLILSAK